MKIKNFHNLLKNLSNNSFKNLSNNLYKSLINISKKFPAVISHKKNFFVFSFLFMIIASITFSYNTSIKQKRLEEIDSFLSNNQTVLLKNYLLNQLKSPYLEYEYVVKNNDTVGIGPLGLVVNTPCIGCFGEFLIIDEDYDRF